MKEYSLDDKVIKLLSNRGMMKHKDVVLWYVRCKVKKLRNQLSVETTMMVMIHYYPKGLMNLDMVINILNRL